MNIALFVGKQFYATFDEYIYEAIAETSITLGQTLGPGYGCCRRVPVIPNYIDVGDSIVYLLHRADPDEPAHLFGWFTLDGIIKCELQQQMSNEVRYVGNRSIVIPALRIAERDHIPVRGCGQMDPPSYYLVGPNDITYQLGFRPKYSNDNTQIHVFDEAYETDIGFFRGFAYVEDIDDLIV